MFVDRIKIFAQAGKGGRGCVSFRREKFVPRGGPDGGDGGRGGDIILRADQHVDNLANLFYEPIVRAKNGGHGKGKKMTGRAGADKIVNAPAGTIVWPVQEEKRPTPINREQASSAQRPTSNSDPIVDLTRDGEEFVLCRGGRAMYTSRVHAIAHRANTPTAKKGRRDTSCLNYERLPMQDWLVIRMPANRRCCGKFRLPALRLRHIRSPRCIRLLG